MAGTQEDIAIEAGKKFREAKLYEQQCGSAQKGTPRGDDYNNAVRARADAESRFNRAYSDYERHMRDNNQRPLPRSTLGG